MSVFRPLNSDESNLFTIRCVITFTSAPSGMIAGGSKLTDASAVTTDLLTTPTPNNLPDFLPRATDVFAGVPIICNISEKFFCT